MGGGGGGGGGGWMWCVCVFGEGGGGVMRLKPGLGCAKLSWQCNLTFYHLTCCVLPHKGQHVGVKPKLIFWSCDPPWLTSVKSDSMSVLNPNSFFGQMTHCDLPHKKQQHVSVMLLVRWPALTYFMKSSKMLVQNPTLPSTSQSTVTYQYLMKSNKTSVQNPTSFSVSWPAVTCFIPSPDQSIPLQIFTFLFKVFSKSNLQVMSKYMEH